MTDDDCEPAIGVRERLVRVEERVAALVRTTELQFTSAAEALHLDAEEKARRLEALNGEAGRLRDMQASYLPREVWDGAFKEINKQLAEMKDFRSNVLGKQSVIVMVVSALTALLVSVMSSLVVRAVVR